jgi:hypothetical protein
MTGCVALISTGVLSPRVADIDELQRGSSFLPCFAPLCFAQAFDGSVEWLKPTVLDVVIRCLHRIVSAEMLAFMAVEMHWHLFNAGVKLTERGGDALGLVQCHAVLLDDGRCRARNIPSDDLCGSEQHITIISRIAHTCWCCAVPGEDKSRQHLSRIDSAAIYLEAQADVFVVDGLTICHTYV